MPTIPFWKHPVSTVVWLVVWVGWSIAILIISPPATTIPVGGDPTTGLRDHDDPYLAGFWPAEPRPWQPASETALRWSKAEWQISWPHFGAGWWVVQFRTDLTGKPSHTPTLLHWHSPAIGSTMLPATQRITRILVNATANDTPNVAVTADVFQPNGDARSLGIAVTAIHIQPLSMSIRPTLMCAFLVVCLFGCWVITHQVRILIPFVMGVLWVCFPALIAIHSELLIQLSVANWGIGLAWEWVAQRWQMVNMTMAKITLSMVWLQLLAIWSPFSHSSDIAMHVRMLNQVMSGQLLFTAQLPCEASAYLSPYPPLPYIIMAPLAGLSHDGIYQRLLLTGGAVVLQAIAICYCAIVLRHQLQLSKRAETLFLLIAFINMPLMRAIHVGELSNAWGQSIALIALCSWIDPHATRQRQVIWTTMALLSHMGVSISLGLMLGLFAGFRLITTKHLPRWLVGSGIGVALFVVGMYYSNFAFLIGQPPGYAGCPPIIPIITRFTGIGEMFPLIMIGWTIIGLLVLNPSLVRTWIGAGIGAAILSIALLLVTTQTVRWGIAVAPFVAIACAYGFHRLWRFGYASKITIVMLMAWYGVFWYSELWHRIMVYLHD